MEYEKRQCKECKKLRLYLNEEGFCVFCRSDRNFGNEIKKAFNTRTAGTWIRCKSGNKKENMEFSQYR